MLMLQSEIHPSATFNEIEPSWSWASVNVAVVMPDEWTQSMHLRREDAYLQANIRIDDAKCFAPGLNPFGKVAHGYIIVTGTLTRVMLNSKYNPNTELMEYTIDGHIDGPIRKTANVTINAD